MTARPRNPHANLVRSSSLQNVHGMLNPMRSVRTLVAVVGFAVALLAMFRGTLHQDDIYNQTRLAHRASYNAGSPVDFDKHSSSADNKGGGASSSLEGAKRAGDTHANMQKSTDPSESVLEHGGSKSSEGERNREGDPAAEQKKTGSGKEHRKGIEQHSPHDRGAGRLGVGAAHSKPNKSGKPEHVRGFTKETGNSKKEPTNTGFKRSEKPSAGGTTPSTDPANEARDHALTDAVSKAKQNIVDEEDRTTHSQELVVRPKETVSGEHDEQPSQTSPNGPREGETSIEMLSRHLKDMADDGRRKVEELNLAKAAIRKQQDEQAAKATQTSRNSGLAIPAGATPSSAGLLEETKMPDEELDEDEALAMQQEAEAREHEADEAEKAASRTGGAEEEQDTMQQEELAISIEDPAVKNLLSKRKPHPGPFMHLHWPTHDEKARRGVHLRLHLRQFFEDGSFGMNTNSKHGSKNIIGQRPYLDYVAEGGDNNLVLSRYTFHPAVLPFLPKEDASWHFNTCAIVSNSGSLLDSEYGAEIDSRDAVFRINYPPLAGFEKHVGSKSTFEITNMHHVQLIADPTWRHPLLKRGTRTFRAPLTNPNGGTATLVLFESTVSTGWRFHLVPRLLHRYPSPKTVILSPDLVVAGEEAWRHIYQDVADKTDTCKAMARRAERQLGAQQPHLSMSQLEVCKPTSGWHTLVFASQICDEVHMYGFSGWRKHSKVRQAKYHYFDNVTGVTNVHSFDLSLRIYQELGKHFKVFVHT